MRIIPVAVSSRAALAALKLQKHSPKLMFAAGVVGVVGTAVLAARASLRLEDVLESSATNLRDISLRTTDAKTYTEQDKLKDKAYVQLKTVLAVGRLYAPAVGVGVLSIGLLAGSHTVLTRRNAALTAAYATLDQGFKQYRSRVVSELGEETDRKFLHAGEKSTLTTISDDGKKTKIESLDGTEPSAYGVLFGPSNPNWNREQSYNFVFLRGVQNYLNDRLKTNGFVMLNDAYDELGVPRTTPGSVVGWVLGGEGDDFVDFGIFDDADALRIWDYCTGREDELYIDFNVDGVVYDKIDKINRRK
jgi:hypothetical protein